MKKILLIITSILLLSTGILTAQGLKLESSLERNRVSPGNPVYLYVTFFGSQDAPKPDVQQIDGLKINYVGPATKVSIINGKISKSISHTYLIMPQSDGEYELGPYSIDYRGQIFVSPPISLRVGSVPSGTSASTARTAARRAPAKASTSTPAKTITRSSSSYKNPNPKPSKPNIGYKSDRIFVVMDVDKTTMYVNEKINVTIKLFVNNMEVKDIGYPVYGHEGFTAEAFEKPERTMEYLRGVRHEALVFKQSLFGVKEGRFTLGPVKIECKIVSQNESSRRSSFFGFDSFFSNRFGSKTYPVELMSDDVPVHILPFPKSGRTSGFQGAVGDFSLEVYPQANKVKVGDPVVLKSIIKGYGNLATVTAPILSDIKGFKTYEPQVIIKGVSKLYEQILIPTSEKTKEIPKVSFTYFNPRTRKYVALEKGPFPLSVEARPGGESQIKMVSADTSTPNVYIPKEKLGEDIIHIKDNLGHLSDLDRNVYENKYFLGLPILSMILFFFIYFGHRRKTRVLKDKGYARLLKAPRKARKGLAKAKTFIEKGENEVFYETLFKTFQEYLGNKFNLSKGNLNYQIIEKELRDHNCEDKVINQVNNVFEKCDMIRFSSSSSEDNPGDFLKTVREIIDYLEKKRI